MKEFVINKEFTKNIVGEEFEEIVKNFTQETGKNFEEAKKEFFEYIKKITVMITKESIETITKTVKTCFASNCDGYVEFGGNIIRIRDFCAVKVEQCTFESKEIN